MASHVMVQIRVRRKWTAPLYWAFALSAVWLLMADPEQAAEWYCRKAFRFEVV